MKAKLHSECFNVVPGTIGNYLRKVFIYNSASLQLSSYIPPLSSYSSFDTLSCAIVMATKTLMRHPMRMTSDNAPFIFNSTFRRTFTSAYRPITKISLCAPLRPTSSSQIIQQSFRRSYADTPPVVKPRRRAGFFRWTWRLVYVSTIGSAAYLAYVIYDLRTPPEQVEPDPSKKTLVILGA